MVGHAQLLQAFTLPPFLQEPHPSIEQFVGVVHVSQMGRGQGHVGIKLVLELLQVRQGRSAYQPAHAVPDEADPGEAGHRAEALDVLLDFIGQVLPHLHDVSFGLVLVGRGREEDGVGVHDGEVVLEEAHVAGVALETVDEDEEVDSAINEYLDMEGNGDSVHVVLVVDAFLLVGEEDLELGQFGAVLNH